MSQPATETSTRAGPATGSAAGNVFTRKYGPLPGWGWAALAGVAAIGYWWYRNKQGAAAAASSAGTAAGNTDASAGVDYSGELSTIQSEIQTLQGEESTEGSSTGTSNSGSGSTAKEGKYRHVSTGKETLNQIAKARNTSVADLVSISKNSPEDAANLAKLTAWAAKPGSRRKGVVYYTKNK